MLTVILIALNEILIKLLLSLLSLPTALSLRSRSSEALGVALSKLLASVYAGNVDRDRLVPLLGAALDADSDSDQAVWENAIKSVEELTPPPQPGAVVASQQTPSRVNSGSLVNTSELPDDMDLVLNQELKEIYADEPNFRQSYFCIDSLDQVATSVLERCRQSDDPLFSDGWTVWPQVTEEQPVLSWFSNLNEKLVLLAKEVDPALQLQQSPRLRTKPTQPIVGSTAKRMMDIGYVGFVDDDEAVDFSIIGPMSW